MKKEYSTLSKRLKQYSALAGSMAAVVGVAHGQVMYTDIPDTVITPVNIFPGDVLYALDLNNDGITDFNFVAWKTPTSSSNSSYFSGFGLIMHPYSTLNENGIIGTATTTGLHQGVVSELALNHNIGTGVTSHIFFKYSQIIYNTNHHKYPIMLALSNGNVTSGQWLPGDTNHYAGLKIVIGGNKHFGWVRVNVDSSGKSITIKDYAYDATNDEPLFAGQGSPLGVSPAKQPGNFNIMAYEGVATIFVNDGKTDGCTVTVTNMLGETIISQSLTNRTTRIDLNQYAKGIYLITVQQGEEIFSKKISFR